VSNESKINAESRGGLEIRHLYKVFGPNPHGAISKLKSGATRDQILAENGQVVAVDNVSFSVGAGEMFVVMGLSGSGKSTLIRCINRLIEPSAGQILIDGEDLAAADAQSLRQARLHKVAMVFQHFALFPHRTVIENVEYGLKIRGMPKVVRRRKAYETLELVGLTDWAERLPDALSGGMRQRVGLARALAVEPQVLLMDEPFGALDPLIRGELQHELVQIQKRLKTAIIFITHDINEALLLGKRIAVMRNGRFIQVGSGDDIVRRPTDDYVAAFGRDVDRLRCFTAASVMRPTTLLSADPAEVGHFSGQTVPANTRLVSLLAHCRSGKPVAVVDEAGKLCGIVNYADILGALDPTPGVEAASPGGEPSSPHNLHHLTRGK